MVQADEGLAFHELSKLKFALESGQTKMQVVDVYGARANAVPPVETNAVSGMEDTPAFLGGNRYVDVRGLGKRKTAQYSIAVCASGSDSNVRKICSMPKSERVTQDIDLTITVGAFRELVDFLQEHHVRPVVGDDIDDPSGIISPIDTTDTFVDVVGQKLELHVAFSRAAALVCCVKIVTNDDSAR
jgi:hypothetical protein